MKNPEQAVYPYKIELHAHTSPASGCANFTPEEGLAMYKARGVDAVVITNHFTPSYLALDPQEVIEKYLSDIRIARRVGEELQIKVYMGMEIRFPQNVNDYLLYGVTEEDVPMLLSLLSTDIETFSKAYRTSDRLLIQAHPFRNGMVEVDPALLDGIEVFNMHPGHNSRVGFAARYAASHPEWILTGGSDFHHLDHDGVCTLRAKELPRDERALAALLRSQDYRIDLSGIFVTPYI